MKKTAQPPKTTCPDCRANCRKPVQRKTIQKLAPWFFSILLICLLMQLAFAAAYALDAPNAQEPPVESTDPICRIDDQAALLTNEQRERLYTEGIRIAQTYDCGLYLLTLEDAKTAYDGADAFDAAVSYYHANRLGFGADRDGLLLVLSMRDRDYGLFLYGPWADTVFTEAALTAVENAFLDDFRQDNWNSGFQDYLHTAEECLRLAQSGTPVEDKAEKTEKPPLKNTLMTGFALGIPIALIICLKQKAKLKSVRKQTQADRYVSGEGLTLAVSNDIFSHTVRRRTRIQNESNRRSGSSGSRSRTGGSRSSSHSRSGGGGRGRSGKF